MDDDDDDVKERDSYRLVCSKLLCGPRGAKSSSVQSIRIKILLSMVTPKIAQRLELANMDSD